MDTREQFAKTTIALHWIVGLTVIFMVVLGFYMATVRAYPLWPLHKSLGSVVLVFVLLRSLWRLRSGWPQPVSVYSKFEQRLSRVVHWTLLVATVVMPITGIISGIAGGYAWVIFGWRLTPDNVNPATANLAGGIHKDHVLPRNAELHDGLGVVHQTFAYILAACIVLHIAGALKHHLIDKDGTLRRICGARIA